MKNGPCLRTSVVNPFLVADGPGTQAIRRGFAEALGDLRIEVQRKAQVTEAFLDVAERQLVSRSESTKDPN